jgi:hypothetical protein
MQVPGRKYVSLVDLSAFACVQSANLAAEGMGHAFEWVRQLVWTFATIADADKPCLKVASIGTPFA